MKPHPATVVVKQMLNKKYWTTVNTVEFICFMNKLVIIIPGLLFGVQWWGLYVIAAITSAGLVWSSTVKTLPTIILFNVMWILLALTAIIKHFI
jgi:hypothetical protein